MTLQTSMDTPKINEEQPVAHVDREIDCWQAAPLLPGTSMPAAGPLPTVRIYQPARSVMQSGPGRRHWVLEFQSREHPAVDPLIGWFGGGEPVSQLRLEFPDAQSAVTFAERHGWRYEFEVSPPRRIPPKSYTERFKYELADALRWAESWKGPAVNDRTREEISTHPLTAAFPGVGAC
jgi:hypothetical protein